MFKKRAWKRVLASVLTLATVFSTAFSPMMTYASTDTAFESEYPELDEVKDQLESDEIVTVTDIEVENGSSFDASNDFTGITYDSGKVKITLHEAKDSSGNSYSSATAGSYKAVYAVVPTSGNPSYRVSRTITVKEAQTEAQTQAASAQDTDSGDEDSGDSDSSDDGEADLQSAAELSLSGKAVSGTESETEDAAESTSESTEDSEGVTGEDASETETETAADSDEDSGSDSDAEVSASADDSDSDADTDTEAETGTAVFSLEETDVESSGEISTEGATEMTIEEFESELEASEDQETVDEETGLTLSEVLAEASEQGIALTDLDAGETVEYSVSVSSVSATALTASSSTESVTITKGERYYYADYGLGSYYTSPYYVSYGSITATAYCVQPSKSGPDDGTYTITKLSDSKTLAKVCYYGTKASDDEGFFATYYPDFSTGKRFIITHLAAAYANGSSDAFSGANSTGQALALELYNYCVSQPEIPDVAMSFSNDDVTAYIDGDGQRTEEITFSADELQTITLNLPDGVKLHNTTTGEVSEEGASVTISGGTTFYLSAPLTQASDVSGSWSSKMKGSITKEYSAYKITTGTSTQDLAFVFGEGVTSEKYVTLSVTWIQMASVKVVKVDSANSKHKLSGAVFGIYSDEECTELIEKMPATDENGVSEVEFIKTQDTVYLKEITAPAGYRINTTTYNVELVDNTTTTVTVPDEEQLGELTVYKEGQVLTGATVTSSGVTFTYENSRLPGAVYNVYAGEDIYNAYGSKVYSSGDLVKEGLTTGTDGMETLTGLVLGTYVVKEAQAPANYYNSGESKTVTLTSAGETVEAVFASVTFSNDRQKASVSVIKVDSSTQTPLPNAVFGLYAAGDIKNAAGTVVVEKGTLIESVTTGSDGRATFTTDLPIGYSYEVKELQAPAYYVRNSDDSYSFTFSYTDDSEKTVTFSHTFSDERVSAHITLYKRDSETGETAQGDATLEGAVYGLYAHENIAYPDGVSGTLYEAGDLVATLTTDVNGEAEIDDLYLGSYYVKEITPPVGYVLDENEYDLTCSYDGDLTAKVELTCTSQEDVIKQPFQIIKAANNGKTDADLLSGVGFTVYLVSSLSVNADGSYDFDSAEPVVVTADGGTEMFTDEKGYACSIALPYGTYIVRETTTPHNYSPVDDFIVTITENNPDEPQTWRVLLDEEFEAKLKIIKKDDETKQTVLRANTEFKVYDIDNGCYVEQVTTYPTTTVHTSYFTDSEGYLILPNTLAPGNYRIEELTAPYGYTLSTDYVEICVDSNTAYLIDSVSGDVIIEVTYENQSVKGELTIVKSGETLKGYKDDFIYEEATLAGAVFEVYAAEDIYTADCQTDANGNRRIVYAKGTLVATVTTDENGKAVVSDLPLGKYEVKEATAPVGYTLNTVSQTVEFVYADQNTAVVKETLNFSNERQKVEITVEKQNAQTGAVVAGAVFGIYNAEDITANGKVIVEADTLLQEMTSDEDGIAACTLDLPLGQYYVKELSAPDGFVSSDEVLTFDASYQGQDVKVVALKSVKKNEPTTVEITKSDLTTGVELSGASLTVTDSKGNEVDSWVSVAGEAHVIQYLVVGETYTLHEEIAPYGYLKATDITFTIGDTAEVQKVEMQDEVPTATLIINKKGEFLESVTLISRIKGILEYLFNYLTGSLSNVTFEVYAAEDIKAADGVSADYYSADELVATITTDETGTAKLEGLPVGKYYVKEVETVSGYVLDDEIRYVDLSYQDQDTAVIVYDEDWQNERQKVSVSVVKIEKDTDRTLEGAIFGLFAAEDIVSAAGTVLIPAGEIIELKTTDENGRIDFVADLPMGASCYVQELYAPAGFVTTGETREFTVEWQGEDVEEQTFEFTFEDEATTVEITKTDLTTGEELPGAQMQVVDVNGNVVDEWTSTGEAHVIKELEVGRTYTLIETKPADGYATAESIEFTIENTAEIQKVVMEDDVTTVEISKTDLTTGEELPGAELVVTDEEGNVVDEWTSTEETHIIEKLVVGKTYTLTETKPADGYTTAESIEFIIEDTAEVQKVEMKDDVTTVEISKTDLTTGEELPGAELVVTDEDGNVVDEWTSTEEPHIIEKLVVGKMYTLTETKPADGYTTAERIEFTIEDTAEVQKVEMKDDVTTVEISKTDLTTGEKLPGAKLVVTDEDGNIVDEWTSTEEPHIIEKLVVGKLYTLTEVKPADGYVTAESIEFYVEDTAEIQKVEMKDDVTKLEISKQDIAGNELPGATLTIFDEDGNVVESWISTDEPHYIEMIPVGKYTLREETAPDGYVVAEDVEFEVLDTGEVQCVTMVDETAPVAATSSGSDVPKTGDDTPLLLWLVLLLTALGCFGCAALVNRRRKKAAQ
ncbi:MAG: peptidase [Lachnospiraceae bacterium]|nr:peptidase [Lachnospiraceae bacterium]